MENSLTINYDNLQLLVEGADRIVLAPEGEQLLIKLLKLKEEVDLAIKNAKERIGVAMEALDPDLASISTENIKVSRRFYGAKYILADVAIETIEERFYNSKESYTANGKEIEKFIKESGALPSGVTINDRNSQVTLKLKENYGRE